MTSGIIDRFEGQYALVKIAGAVHSISRRRLPADAREGDVIVLIGRKWVVDEEASAGRLRSIQDLADRLWK